LLRLEFKKFLVTLFEYKCTYLNVLNHAKIIDSNNIYLYLIWGLVGSSLEKPYI